MVPLERCTATDRRVYNGAPCSDMAREMNRTADLKKRMVEASPDARCVFFPIEEKYLVFIGIEMLTGNFHDNMQDALIEAIRRLAASGRTGYYLA